MKSVLSIICILLLTLPAVDSFAAGRKGGKKNVGRGFGLTPKQPSLEEVVAKFPVRVPANAPECKCPCGSGKVYMNCCEPFHQKEKLPGSPLDVLRSRYTAFVWRLPLYILDTTHHVCTDFRTDKVAWVKDLNRDGMFDSYDFINLEAGPQEISEDNDKEGFIEFKVTLRANSKIGEVEGQMIVVREKSRFLCSGDPASWLYADGTVTSDVAGLEDVVLNN